MRIILLVGFATSLAASGAYAQHLKQARMRAIENHRWLRWATTANALARVLAQRLAGIPGVEIAYPVEANLVFACMPETLIEQLRTGGAEFYDWGPPAKGRRLVRFVTSFATPENDIERLIAAASGMTD